MNKTVITIRRIDDGKFNDVHNDILSYEADSIELSASEMVAQFKQMLVGLGYRLDPDELL